MISTAYVAQTGEQHGVPERAHVNGEALLEDGRHTGALPGRVIRNSAYQERNTVDRETRANSEGPKQWQVGPRDESFAFKPQDDSARAIANVVEQGTNFRLW